MQSRSSEKNSKKLIRHGKLCQLKMAEVALFLYVMEKYLTTDSECQLPTKSIDSIKNYINETTMKIQSMSLSNAITSAEKTILQEDMTIDYLDDLHTSLSDATHIYQQYKKILKTLDNKFFDEIKKSQTYKDDTKLQITLNTYQLYRQLRKDVLSNMEKKPLESINRLVTACQTLQMILTQQPDLQSQINLLISPTARLRELIDMESYRVRGRGMTRATSNNNNDNTMPHDEMPLSVEDRLADLELQDTHLKVDGKEMDFAEARKKLLALEKNLQDLSHQLSIQKQGIVLFPKHAEAIDTLLTVLLDNKSGLLTAFVNPIGKMNLVLGIDNLKDWMKEHKPHQLNQANI